MNFNSRQIVDARTSPSLRPFHGEASVSSSQKIRDEEAATLDVDDYQNFMQFYSTVAPHGRLSPMNLPTQPRWSSLSAGGFDGMAYNFIAARGGPKHSSLVGVAVMEGMIVPLADRVPRRPVQVRTQQAEFFYGPMMGAWTTAALFAGEAGLTSLDGRWGTHLTLNSNGQARSEVTLHQKFDRVQAAAEGHAAAFEKICHRRGRDAATAALRRVEIQRARGPGAQMMPALSLFQQLQMLCRIDYSSVCDVTFGTFIDDTAAHLLAREKATLWGRFIKPTWRALWGLDALPVPDLLHPEHLQPGDRIVEKRWTRKTFLSAFGKLLFFLGFHRAQFVQSTLAVTRPLESVDRTAPKIRVQLAFSSVNSGRLWAALVGNLTGHRGEHHMHREVHEIEVVLSNPRICEAYRNVIGAARDGTSSEEQFQLLCLLRAAALEEKQLGARLDSTRSDGRSQTGEFGSTFVGLGLGLIAPWLPTNFSIGMSRRRVHSRHDVVTKPEVSSAGSRLLLAGTADIARRGPDGERTTRISAKTWVSLTDEKRLPVFTLEARISLGRADTTEVEQLLVGPLKTHFGIPLNVVPGSGNLVGAGWRTGREVVYRQDASCAALLAFASNHLSALEEKGATNNFSLTLLSREIMKILRDFSSDDNPDSSKIADTVMGAFGRYFENSDLASFGALASVLKELEPDALALLESECDAYGVAARERQAIAQKLDNATEDEARALLNHANKTVRPLLFQVERLVGQDPFLGDASRSTLLATIKKEEQMLGAAFANYVYPDRTVDLAERRSRLQIERALRPYGLSESSSAVAEVG